MTNGFRPTLLVGIGGTGCRIADAVYREVIANGVLREGRMAVLGFDTDDNDMRRLSSLERRQQIRFSNAHTVFRLLKDNPDVHRWFVPEERLSSELRNMTLIEGAGQVRMLSRLALHVALKDPQVRLNIEGALDRLATHDNRELFESWINVLLVGSLAGATGSGAFLQVALLLGELARRRMMHAEVRGLFLLPDVFFRAGRLPTQQIPHIQANGYAALKELNAIVAFVTGRGLRNLDFEYAPGLTPQPDAMPMQSVTLLDFENSKGNLGPNLQNYTRMAERAAYTLLFSPIGARVASVAVNDVRTKLAAAARDGAEIYSGVGVGAIVYPVRDMHSYLALRLVTSGLSSDWLRLDQLFRQKVRQFQERREQGDVNAQPPDPGRSYLEDLDNLATREPRIAFFREIYDRLYPKKQDEYEEAVRPQHDEYLNAIEDWMTRSLQQASDLLKECYSRQPIDSRQLEDRDMLVENARRLERVLDRDWRMMDTAARERPDDMFTALWSTADTLSEREWLPHHLQHWILAGGAHLVQVRYFLYAVRRETEARRKKLNSRALQDDLFRLALRFDKDKGDQSRSTPKLLEEARAASEQGILGRLVSRKHEDFTRKFADYFNASLRLIREWGETRLKERLYERLEQELGLLIRVVEELFLGLEQLQLDLHHELGQLTDAHRLETGGLVGNLYVYADPPAKDDLWQRFGEMPGSKRQGATANTALARMLYDRYRERRSARSTGRAAAGDIGLLFRKALLDDFARPLIADEYRSLYDFSIIEALRREMALTGRDWQQRLRDAVLLVGGQAEPFLMFSHATAGQRVMFWAISPAVQEEYGDRRGFDELFTFNQGESPLILPEFSPYELLCLNTRVNLDLRDIGKLHPGDTEDRNVNAPPPGAYFVEYERMIQPLLAADLAGSNVLPSAFTPHLHYDWHKPGKIPEFFPHRQRAVERNLCRGFVMSAATDVLKAEEDYGRRTTVLDLSASGLGRYPLTSGVEGHNDWYIFNQIEQRPELLNAITQHWQQRRNRELAQATSVDFDAVPLVQALARPALAARMLAIGLIREDEERRDRRLKGLLDAQFDLVQDLVERGCRDLAPIGRRDRTLAIVEGLTEPAFAALSTAGVRRETEAHLRGLMAETQATFRRRLDGGA